MGGKSARGVFTTVIDETGFTIFVMPPIPEDCRCHGKSETINTAYHLYPSAIPPAVAALNEKYQYTTGGRGAHSFGALYRADFVGDSSGGGAYGAGDESSAVDRSRGGISKNIHAK